MLKNYIKIGWRNFTRHKSFGLINVLGLAAGISCSILVYLIVSYHLGFDTYHSKKDRIYRIVTEWHDQTIDFSPGVPPGMGRAFRTDFGFAEETAMVTDYRRSTAITFPGGDKNKKYQEKTGVAYAQPAFFRIFDIPLEKGDKKAPLSHANTALITSQLARKYFGDTEALGQVIRVNNQTDFTITGVLRDLPQNTDLKQEIYLSYANLKERNPAQASDTTWGGVYSGSRCYTLLKRGLTAARVNAALPKIAARYYSEKDAKIMRFKIQPLSDIHFNPDFDGPVDRKFLWGLIFIGLFLVITACMNFVNLATAQALNRSREVGIRKVLGGRRGELFWQFMSETAVIVMFSVFLAMGLAWLALPWVNQLMEIRLKLDVIADHSLVLFLVITAVIVAFLSGSYPGLVMARFKPIVALRNKISQRHIGGVSLRRVLVVGQFAISQGLIIVTLVVAGQISFSQRSSLGFTKDNIVVIPVPDTSNVRMQTLKSRIDALTAVTSSTLCFQPPASGSNATRNVRYDQRPEDEHWDVNEKRADDNYLSTFGLKLVAGRNLFPADTLKEFLVNETFVRKLGLRSPDEILGKTIYVDGGTKKGPVVGVLKDFYNYSFRLEVSAVCIGSDYRGYSSMAVKAGGGVSPELMANISRIWNETYPEQVYSYQFLDERVAEFYKTDAMMLSLFRVFAGIAIFIGGMGLYGLISFMAARRTKEIGLRKVLGAGISHILWLFGREISLLLVIAFLIAAPTGWFAMHGYLQDFRYRITPGPGIFLSAIAGTFLIAVLTIGYRTLRAATAKPVKSLRNE